MLFVLAIVLLLIVVVVLGVVAFVRRTGADGLRLLSSHRRPIAALCTGFPFKRIVNERDQLVGVVIGAPFRSADAQGRALELRRLGVPLVGFTSYQNFPGSLRHNPFEDAYHYAEPLDYVALMRAWCTCFREPSAHGLSLARAPHQLDLAESDFAEPTATPRAERAYDFAYVCLPDAWNSCDDGWQAYCRNWHRAKRILDLVAQRGYRGVLVGRSVCARDELPAALAARTVRTPLVAQAAFWDLLARSRCLFVPNQFDASPRVITEAIQLDVGVLVNSHILGGWKYVDPSNGAFFDPTDADEAVAAQLIAMIERQQTHGFSGATFRARFGRARTSRRLAAFLNKVLGRADAQLFLA